MKYNKEIESYLNKITYRLKWNIAIIHAKNDSMYAYDYDNHCRQSISALVVDILNDGFIEDVGFTKNDIKILCNILPKKALRDEAKRIFLNNEQK